MDMFSCHSTRGKTEVFHYRYPAYAKILAEDPHGIRLGRYQAHNADLMAGLALPSIDLRYGF